MHDWLRVLLVILLALLAFMGFQLALGAMSPGYLVVGVAVLAASIAAIVKLVRRRPHPTTD